jgi:hypothetical protein
MSDSPIDTSVSISLHPSIVDRHAAALGNGRTAPIFEGAKSAMATMYKNASLLNAARKSQFEKVASPGNLKALTQVRAGKHVGPVPEFIVMGKAGPELTLPPAMARNFNQAAEESFRRTAFAATNALKNIETERQILITERAHKSSDPSGNTPKGISIAQETRNLVRSLPETERAKMVREAIKSGDAQLSAAICDTPHYLSGLKKAEHDNLVQEAWAQFAPFETEKLTSLDSVKATIEDAYQISMRTVNEARVAIVGADSRADAALSQLKTGGQ